MVISMTGFGRGKAVSGSFSVNVEVKTVNHRFSEMNIRMPRQLLKIEDKIKKKLNEHIRRGRVEVYVSVEGEGVVTRKVHVDWKLIEEYYQFIEQARSKYGIEGTITLQDLLNRTDLLHIEESEAGNEEIEVLVLSAVEEAVILLKQMRSAEGEEIKKDLLAITSQLEADVFELQKYAPLVVQSFKERLTKRMHEFINGQLDETRILTEVAIFADKADINEEITRLKSHIQQFLQTLDDQEPIGRKLDFIVQEMNREANTIGSKANDSNIAKKVVEIKSLLEKLKEQVQNIE
ncbi:YicC family protein [Neobacillus sp. MM2021_6]|uniref:YicC/YloC family endoribonuclease n=1 Tax=Bacillaceae TaxID=186817 RepID=UPI0014084F95|nr:MULTISPECIES: YicC/YloC family endoribonuclease [Bacillaceae]MBO0959170.1 YicC family protein [Neobacillus sp. MM2021_6]NHC16911.1 YicC family protein [Bacillus sp. MM2020_4]WML39038.1 YicC/YloC family endoribonuclease [Neobacillus sp. OS1-2]